VSLGGQQSIDG